MEQSIYLVTLVGTGLVVAAAFSSMIAFRFGAPLLLLFLGIGLITGTDGLGIDFDNASIAYFVGSIALAVILFDSGFGTPVATLRQAAAPAVVLATVGVIVTSALFGLVAHFAAGLGWLEAFLLGAAVGSTDAAAVFFLLRAGNVHLRERVRSTLEIESGSNDPIAIFLTLTLVGAIAAGTDPEAEVLALDIFLGFLTQMVIGIATGFLGGWAIVRLVDRLQMDQGLLPIFVLTLSMMVFAAGGAAGGSGFLAVYVAGLVAGNAQIRAVSSLRRFQSGMSWLAQIIMFLVLGLFATPSQFPEIIFPAILLGLALIFFARPVAVWLCLIPFRFSRNESVFIAGVGLRGAVSILLAITPLLYGLENGRTIFNYAFIVVLVSLAVQGWMIRPAARRLGLIVPPRSGSLDKVELELPGSAHHELLAFTVAAGSPVARGERIPRWARPSLVVRNGRSMRFQDSGRLEVGDRVYIFVPDRYPRLLDRLFATRAALGRDDEDFFGAFAIDPARPASELEAAYGTPLSEEERNLTIGELIVTRLRGHAEYADRVSLGPIELIVRDVDEKGRIAEVGLSTEPAEPPPPVPFYMTARELGARIAAWLRSRRRPASGEATRDEAAVAPQPDVPAAPAAEDRSA